MPVCWGVKVGSKFNKWLMNKMRGKRVIYANHVEASGPIYVGMRKCQLVKTKQKDHEACSGNY